MTDGLHQADLTVSVFAPVSVGNVSVGFDSLGLAVTPMMVNY